MKTLIIAGVLIGMYLGGFVSATYASRDYIQRHWRECYTQGSTDMRNAIFGALDRIVKEHP